MLEGPPIAFITRVTAGTSGLYGWRVFASPPPPPKNVACGIRVKYPSVITRSGPSS